MAKKRLKRVCQVIICRWKIFKSRNADLRIHSLHEITPATENTSPPQSSSQEEITNKSHLHRAGPINPTFTQPSPTY